MKDVKVGFAHWYAHNARILGWIGLALIVLSFLNKEVFQKKLEKKKTAAETSLKVIDADETSRLQISSGRVYGTEKMDLLESFQMRLEYILKLTSKDEYFERRTHQLQENESVAHSDFLPSKGLSADTLQQYAASLMPVALAATSNIAQCRKAEGKSETQLFGKDIATFRKEVSEKAESVFKSEHDLFSLLNNWADAQRNSLKLEESKLKTKSLYGEIFTYVLFTVGFLLAALEKASGKVGKAEVPGQGD
jgi:hypothetical protein